MALAGRNGRFDWATGEVADLREWTINIDRDLFDVSTFGSSNWRQFMQNLNGASGSVSGYWNVTGSTAMADLQNNLLNASTAASIEFHVDGSGNGYTASAWVSSISPSASVDGIVEFSADFTIEGAVSYSTTLST